MIKAEIISHEGNPGPNWLDRCRSLISPASISTIVVLVAVAGIAFAVTNKQSDDAIERAANSGSSTPADVAQPLTVQSSTAQTYQAADGGTTVQAATGGAENPVNPNDQTASGRPDTNGQAPLNNTATTPDVSQQGNVTQGTLRNRSLINNLQSSLPSLERALDSVNNARDNVRGAADKR